MKRLFIILLLLAGCGSQQVAPADPLPASTTQASLKQPFVFQEIGDEIPGMLMHLEQLPDGKWLVLNRDGVFTLLDENFKIIAFDFLDRVSERQVYDHIGFDDSGAMSFALDPDFESNHQLYVYFTFKGSEAPCDTTLCNLLMQVTLGDPSNLQLISQAKEIATFPMLGFVGAHNGGGLAFDDEGGLYVAVGDGAFPETLPNFSQDADSPLGKVIRFDTRNNFQAELVGLGLRNPFTMVPVPGGVAIGDVGSATFEEVDVLPFGPTLNFGWPLTEGSFDAEKFSDFTEPLVAFKHCDERYKDEDPESFAGKGLVIKNHNGVVHPCNNEVVTVAGYYELRSPNPYNGDLDDTLIYSEAYFGWIRGLTLGSGEDRHLAHFPGLVSLKQAEDGYLYGVSIFASNHVLKLVPNP